jgi:hypothetical protein
VGAIGNVRLFWSGPSQKRFEIEGSTNCLDWSAIPATVTENSTGTYQGEILTSPSPHRFFRIRLAD